MSAQGVVSVLLSLTYFFEIKIIFVHSRAGHKLCIIYVSRPEELISIYKNNKLYALKITLSNTLADFLLWVFKINTEKMITFSFFPSRFWMVLSLYSV